MQQSLCNPEHSFCALMAYDCCCYLQCRRTIWAGLQVVRLDYFVCFIRVSGNADQMLLTAVERSRVMCEGLLLALVGRPHGCGWVCRCCTSTSWAALHEQETPARRSYSSSRCTWAGTSTGSGSSGSAPGNAWDVHEDCLPVDTPPECFWDKWDRAKEVGH